MNLKELGEYYERQSKELVECESSWIKVTTRLPTIQEMEENWKFIVANNESSNDDEKWVDCAYFDDDVWNNGECEIIPTHWITLPKVPKS